MITRIQALCLLCFALLAGVLQAQTIHPWHLDGEVYVKYKNSYTMPAHGAGGVYKTASLPGVDADIAKLYGVTAIQSSFFAAKSTGLTHILRVSLDKYKTGEFIKFLQGFSFIDYAEPVPYNVTGYTPNDLGGNGSAGGQWFLWKIQAQQAWDYSKGDSTVTVAIVDDELLVYHPDLFDNVWRNPGEISGNGIDDDNNGYIDDIYGYDVADRDNNPVHTNTAFTHGTHVGGIVGATTDNSTGIASIGYNVSLIGVKCTYNNQSSVVSIPMGYEGITYAANAGANIINCSWSSGFYSATADSVINYANSMGCLVFAAASNDGVEQIRYPAAYNGVIAVASTEQNDTKSDFSNYGTWVDISAPGRAIRSTLVGSTPYGNLDGTSMATPLVAGLAGLMKSHNKYATNAQLQQCLLSSADDISSQNPSYTGKIGSGRINAEKALQCMNATLNQPPVAKIESSVSIACPNAQVSFSGTSVKGPATGYQWYFPGGSPSSSTLQNPVVSYTGLGTYDVTLVVTNSQGKDSLTLKDYIDISAYGREEIFSRDFETGTLADMGFTVENPDNGITWGIGNVGGNGSSKALYMNFYSYSAVGQRDALITPVINLGTHANTRLFMQHAYRRQNNNSRDSLIIYASTDGGASYPYIVAAFGEDGTYKFATGSNLATPFTPNASNSWCFEAVAAAGCIDLDLSDFDGQTNVRLKFESYNGFGNNLYIDNLQITGLCAGFNTKKPTVDFSNSDTVFCVPATVKFRDESKDFPASYQWFFEGGAPSSSTAKNPQVVYNTPGTYNVKLVVQNAFGSDSIELNDYIVCSPFPTVGVSAQKTTLCKGESTILTATGADTYSWTPVFAISSTTADEVTVNPPSSVVYKVKGTSSLGCSETQSVSITVLPGPSVTTITRSGDTLFASNSNPTVSFQWLLNGGPINGATSKSYKPDVFGNYAVRVTDTFGCANNSIGYLFSGLGVGDVNDSKINIYPNPAKDQLFVDGLEAGTAGITVTDVLGRSVLQQEIINLKAVNVSALSPGVYLVLIRQGETTATRKIIIE